MHRFLIFLLAIIFPAISIANEDCSAIQLERQIVDAILNLDQLAFDRNINLLDPSIAVIPSINYYQALNLWHQGYQYRDAASKNKGIKLLRKAITRLEQTFNTDESLRGQIALGITKGHGARILIEDEQYLNGYNLGIEAKQHIDFVVESEADQAPGFDDIDFLRGMYEIYTAEVNQQSHWLIASINYRGNREKGIKLVESAIKAESIFATEALRALLGEVSWRIPTFCGYLDIIDQVGSQFRRNADLSVLRQGLLLKCGFTERAHQANLEYKSVPDLPESMKQQITKASYRIAADLGEVGTLEIENPSNPLSPNVLLARANALDVAGRRKEAVQLYNQLTNDEEISKAIQNVATVRISHPYYPPKLVIQPQKLLLRPDQC